MNRIQLIKQAALRIEKERKDNQLLNEELDRYIAAEPSRNSFKLEDYFEGEMLKELDFND